MYIDRLNYSNVSLNSSPAFKSAKAQKLIQKLEQAPILKKVQITFDELERMYNELGYDVIRKRGSHASVVLNEKYTMSIVIPHDDKYVKVNDLKRFLLIKEGKIEEAVNLIHYNHHHH